MFPADRSLVGAEEPALEEGGDAVRSGHEHVCGIRRGGLVDHHMIVSDPRQTGVAGPRIGEDTGPRLHGLVHERLKGVAADVGYAAQAQATEPLLVDDFDGNGHDCLLVRVAPLRPGLLAAHVHLVDLDHANEAITIRPHHGAPQLVQPRPRRLVALDAQHALHVDRVGPVLVPHDLPRREEPELQGFSCALEDRPRRHRGPPAARRAKGAAGRAPDRSGVATGRAYESIRPAQALQEALTGLVLGEEPVQVRPVPRVVHARPKASRVDGGHTTRYSARWHEANSPLRHF